MRDPKAPIPAPLESHLNWNTKTPEGEARARRISNAKIQPVVDGYPWTPGATRIDTALLLAIGEACPFTRAWERKIWSEECDRILQERAEKVAANG
jgi:hypothetical protein